MKNKNLSYQTNAINFAIEHLQNNREFKLQSPTGSGKTFIISKLIDQYLENDILNSKKTTFIFIAPSTGKLDYQGYEKISSYVQRGWVRGFDTEYIGTSNAKTPLKTYLSNIDYFKENRVYFIGWQMFKRGTKITEMNSERNDIYRVIENTKQKDINIVLIIDEAHREIKSSKDDINIKQSIINEMNPYKVIKVSATLEQVNEKPDYTITYDDVREECAIKKNVIISDMINEQLEENKQLIVSAIRKQEEIEKAYQKYKIEINPLILIQIPDNINVDNEIKTEELLLNQIKNILNENNFKEGYDYAIWLNNNKTTTEKDKITNNLSPIKFLIFKTAIATGWDIPRANILVRIRDAKSSSFNIQTLGRILRNPFFKYYDNELIDNAFVFTKDQKYSDYIQQENIVIKENEFKNVERSSKAKNSTFSIKKKLIKNINFDEQEMIDIIIKNIIEDAGYKEFLNYEHPNIVNSSVSISTEEVINANTNKINKEFDKKNETQLMLNTSQNLITLFDLYIKYKTITKSKSFISQILNKLEEKIHLFNKKIKDFYWACIYNWNRSYFNTIHGSKTLLEKINYEWESYKNKNVIFSYEKYVLPNTYKVNLKYYDINDWDNISTFNYKLKNDDEYFSSNEKWFFDAIKNKYDDRDYIHLFRNGVGQDDYYIEYINSENQIRKFYPDFILINESNKTCYIFEAKGSNLKTDIDKETNNKINSIDFIKEKDFIKIEYTPINEKTVVKTSKKKDLEFKDGNKLFTFTEIKKLIEESK